MNTKINKIHFHLVLKVVEIVQAIFFADKYADKVIEAEFKRNKKLGSRDRKFIAELVYDVVRWWRLLWDFIDKSEIDDKRLITQIVLALLIKKEIDKLSKVDSWSAVKLKLNSATEPYKSYFQEYQVSVQLVYERYLQIREKGSLPTLQSYPDWLYKLAGELCDQWDIVSQFMNHQATVDLRCNELKINRTELIQKLHMENIDTLPIADVASGLALKIRANVFQTESFKLGYFEVQDRGSQKISEFCEPEPGQRIADACAGAGGKSLHLATLMKNKGKIVSLDIHGWKLEELKKRANRNGISIIETRHIESTKTIKRLSESFDKVLLDVPCSGLGVIRRNPDTKWKLSLKKINELIETQKDILRRYSEMVKPGGELIYSTCSILKIENQDQIKNFLADNSKVWGFIDEVMILPHENHSDGFYMCKLKKNST